MFSWTSFLSTVPVVEPRVKLYSMSFIYSKSRDQKSFIRFINRTRECVSLYWIDYDGRAISYGKLPPGRAQSIDTFVTHPWIFIEQQIHERYTVNQKTVFYPEPCKDPSRPLRINVYITLPLDSLRQAALRVLTRLLTHEDQAFELRIPKILQAELAIMLMRKYSSPHSIVYLDEE